MKKTKNAKKTGIFGKIFTFLIVFVSIFLSFSLADLFSSLITVGGFSFVSDEVSLSKSTYFAVCISSHQTKIQAEENANICKSQGGAGYLYLNSDAFYVVASIYQNEADATKVKENLTSTKPSCEVLPIEINAITINNNLSEQEKTTLQSSLNIFKTAYTKLYDISVSLDTSIYTEVNSRLMINEVASDVTTQQKNFNTIFKDSDNIKLQKINSSLNKICESFQNLIDYSSTFPYTSKIKNTYCEVVFELKTLANNF